MSDRKAAGALGGTKPKPKKQSQASRFADDARKQLLPRGVETPLMYARRMAGWPPLRG